MGALEDLAAKLNMDPLEFFSKNADLAGERAEVYRQELRKAAELIDWEKNWHPRGQRPPVPSSVAWESASTLGVAEGTTAIAM